MSTYSNRPKLDISVPTDFADFLFEVREGLTGDETETWKADGGDSGAAEVFDPVGAAIKKFAAERFTPEGRELRKRWANDDPFALAIKKASKMRTDGNVMRLYSADGTLIASKVIAQ